MKTPKGKRLRLGVDYRSFAEPAEWAVTCSCGFSTPVDVETEALALAAIRARHNCGPDGVLEAAQFACEACDEPMPHGALIPIKNNGAHAMVCNRCRINIALGRSGLGAGR